MLVCIQDIGKGQRTGSPPSDSPGSVATALAMSALSKYRRQYTEALYTTTREDLNMTRKDYETIADGIHSALLKTPRTHSWVVARVAENIADKLYIDNPRFDYNRFMVASGVMEPPDSPANY